jgi:hypothetical protein
MDRRRFIYLSGAGAAATLAGIRPGLAFNLKHSPDSVFNNLSRAMWASTNRKASKAAYVIAAPWCGVCRALYQAVVAQAPDCDFRFVWQNDRTEQQTKIVYSTYFHDGDNQLVPYELGKPQVEGVTEAQFNLAAGINESTISSVGPHIRPFVSGGGGSRTGFGWGYPTIVHKAKGVVKAVTGMPPDLAALVASIDSGLDRPSPSPQLLACLEKPLALHARKGDRYAQQDKVLLYAAPTTEAPVIEELGRRAGYPVHAETERDGQKWLAFKAFGKPWPLLWGKTAQF